MAVAEDRSALKSRPIALCGFMGVGKSAIGRIVARELHREFFDSDSKVEKRLGRAITELFESGEEALFRAREAEVIAELIERRPAGVISLGGGALENSKTRQLLHERALLVHIDQPWEELRPALSRLRVARPLLLGQSDEHVHDLYLARQANYASAHLTVATTRQGVRAAAQLVLSALEENAQEP